MIGVWALFGQRILVPRLLSISPADSDAAPLFARWTEWGGRRDENHEIEGSLAGHGQGINFHTGSPADGQRDPRTPLHSQRERQMDRLERRADSSCLDGLTGDVIDRQKMAGMFQNLHANHG